MTIKKYERMMKMKLILRAWLPDEKKMLHHDEITLTEGEVYKRIYNKHTGHMNSFRVTNAILMMCIGLKDKQDDKLVFEGDIIEFHHIDEDYKNRETTPIVWLGEEWNNPIYFTDEEYIKKDCNKHVCLSEIFNSGYYKYEIIGNIYENSELLPEKQE